MHVDYPKVRVRTTSLLTNYQLHSQSKNMKLDVGTTATQSNWFFIFGHNNPRMRIFLLSILVSKELIEIRVEEIICCLHVYFVVIVVIYDNVTTCFSMS